MDRIVNEGSIQVQRIIYRQFNGHIAEALNFEMYPIGERKLCPFRWVPVFVTTRSPE